MEVNCSGSINLLEAIKSSEIDPIIVFAGSSEEYGLAIISESKYQYVLNKSGEVYNQCSQRTNSVLTYILLSLEVAGYDIRRTQTIANNKIVESPTMVENSNLFGLTFEKTRIDKLLLEGELKFNLSDVGILLRLIENQ